MTRSQSNEPYDTTVAQEMLEKVHDEIYEKVLNQCSRVVDNSEMQRWTYLTSSKSYEIHVADDCAYHIFKSHGFELTRV